MLSQKKIAEILVNWGLENEKIVDIVFPETGEISDTAKYVGDEYVIKYTSKKMTEWLINHFDEIKPLN